MISMCFFSYSAQKFISASPVRKSPCRPVFFANATQSLSSEIFLNSPTSPSWASLEMPGGAKIARIML